jgi:O-antigen ligase
MRNIALALSLIFSFMIPWEGTIQIAGLGNSSKLMGFVLGAFWVATVLLTGRFRKPILFHVVLYLFVLWNAISAFWSASPNVSIAHIMTWAQLLLLAFIWWDLYTTRTAVLAGLQAYILGAYVAIGNAIANFFAGNAFYTHYDRYSPDATNPDGFAFVMAIGIPIAWYLAVSRENTKFERLLKLVNYAYIPTAFLGIALSGTRTALIASIPGMMFGLASLTRIRLSTRLATFLFFTAAVFILLPYVQTARSFQRLGTTATELTQGDLNNRTNIWREGFAAFAEHPLLGVGANMYDSVNSLGKVAHNSFLSVLVELGLIGLALFGALLTIAVFQARNQPKWDSRFWLTILFVWAIGASTLTWEHRKPTWLLLNLVIASAAIASHRDEDIPLVEHEKPVGHFVRQTQ